MLYKINENYENQLSWFRWLRTKKKIDRKYLKYILFLTDNIQTLSITVPSVPAVLEYF